MHIELIKVKKAEDKKNRHINNRYLNNVLGFNRFRQAEMEEVKEKVEEEEDEANFDVRQYLDK